MRIGELSRNTGVPVPTIKYYVREGLLPPGELTSPNQATYGEAHERRLRLIRALLDVGGMKVAEIADVLAAVDDPERPLHKVLGAAADRLGRDDVEHDDAESATARAVVADLVSRRGWRTHESNPAAIDLSKALAAMGRLGHGAFVEVLDDYADAAEQVARADLRYVDRRVAVESMTETVVIGTVLGEAVFSALRRLAHVDASAQLYGADGSQERKPS
ncbi:MerR family transcriptional regulator [Streptomyces viridochromogenes]|uniref:MerR family transcriptional regulator n=1 Tax=Streptomyces viridochromogenes TaxID=1938 RepID=A0A0J7Z2X9_STRVR|nr:MerR family transcriptional regulator [Streptomyces viridochromogenes]KMS69972.1 MerR family transcriptional regulator [Streptomyces viridochromogenes]KOG15630.1 MerR family transcriptional regulator [Streptomyces viridochromogenes]KOG15682.1 MerR family transcriptional regulator [Streptomyces viridochromogenes]